MRKYHKIKSVLLLLAMFSGLLHSSIPHGDAIFYDGLINICNTEYHPHKHAKAAENRCDNSNKDNHNTSGLIEHSDHYDQNFFDLLVCVLSDLEHPEDTNHSHEYTQLKQLNFNKTLTLSNYIGFVEIPKSEQQCNEKQTNILLKKFSIFNKITEKERFLLRGPPQLS